MAGTIGIKIANGNFYPIIEENSPVKRRLVLTTVHDKQSNVQIDLFRSISKSMLDAQYIGSLLVKTNSLKRKGEPSIEMVISADRDGNINAEAYDIDAGPDGERHVLNVSLQNIDSLADIDNPPDFEFNSRSNKYNDRNTGDDRKFPWLVLVIATLFVAFAIAALWYFFLGGKDVFSAAEAASDYYTPSVIRQEPIPEPPPLPPLPTFEPEPVVIKAPASPAEPKQVKRVRPPAPVMSYRVPAVIPKNGVVYQIQWGDTLWDISAAFYRNPWLYPRIAKDNKIRNPDLIIAGSNLRIYPRK
jgi:hypothetical protein